MKDIRNIYIAIGLIWTIIPGICAQTDRDSLSVSSEWHTLKNYKLSANGQWSAIIKSYENNNDTIEVVHTVTKEKITLTDKGNIEFADNQLIYKSKENILEIIELPSKKSFTIDNISKFSVLQNHCAIVYIKDNKSFHVGNIKNPANKTLFNTKNITDYYISDDENFALLISKNESTNVYLLDIKKLKLSFVTKLSSDIEKIIWNNAQTKALFQTLDKKILLVDLLQSSAKAIAFPKGNDKIISIQSDFTVDDNIFFNYTLETKNNNDHEEYLDIWNGNDRNLEQKKFGDKGNKRFRKCLIYYTNSDKCVTINIKKEQSPIFIRNSENLILFDIFKHKDYSLNHPKTDIYLYNIKSQNSHLIADAVENTAINFSYSPNSEFIAFNKNSQWYIYDINDKKSHQININNQSELFWNNHENAVYIIGDNNLWKVDLTTYKTINITNYKKDNLKIDILNYHALDQKINMLYVGIPKVIDTNAPLLLHNIETRNNSNSIYSVNKKLQLNLITSSENKLSSFQWTEDCSVFTFSEENFNIPKSVIGWKNRKETTLLKGDLSDKLYQWRKQKIVTFKNKEGIILKGLLYYPKDFSPLKKYPMVVHIYQSQNHLANTFFIPDFTNYMGFNIPLLNELGYFVFLPDIIISDEGPGFAALDCVTQSIEEATKEELSIDNHRLGLIGQSFGGYETNFIITQTNLFAAAVSGAAINDIVWDYYSYNYNFANPPFWRYESHGQVEMRGSLKDEKEKYLQNSPILFAHQIKTPLLSWTGLKDHNVHWEHTRHFYIALKKYQIPHIALFYKEEGHSMTTAKTQRDLTLKVIDWFHYFLKDKKDIKWINQGTDYTNY